MDVIQSYESKPSVGMMVHNRHPHKNNAFTYPWEMSLDVGTDGIPCGTIIKI